MNRMALPLLLALLRVPVLCRAAEPIAEPPKSVAEVGKVVGRDLGKKVIVVGEMGLPLGTASRMEIEVVDGDSLRQKQYAGRYVAKVIAVGKDRCASPRIIPFSSRTASVQEDRFSRYEAIFGKKAKQIEDNRTLDRDYVGTHYDIVAYETGAFRGIPSGLPVDAIWQDTAFQFESYLVIVKARKSRHE